MNGSRAAKVVGSTLTLVAVGLLTACSSVPPPTPEETAKYRLGAVQGKCEELVKDRLKSPGSARFSGENTTGDADHGWTTIGGVDSQNSFGALMRMDFRCTATYDAPTDMIDVTVASVDQRN